MLDWLIVGGGIHGTHLSLVLRHAGVREATIRVLDPWEEPLDRWTTLTGRTGMAFLRSPGVHHVGLDPYDLFKFAGRRRARAEGHYHGRYRRPSLDLFQAHARTRICEWGVDALRVQGRARAFHRVPGGYRVETERGGLEARRVVLSLGPPAPAPEPSWTRRLRDRCVPVAHLFDTGCEVDGLIRSLSEGAVSRESGVAVLGGGISAAQLALRLARRNQRVVLVSRHPLRVHPFDSEPGWLGPKHLRDFHRQRCPLERRKRIRSARKRGSLPEEVAGALRTAVARGDVAVCIGEVMAVDTPGDHRGVLHLSSTYTSSDGPAGQVEVKAVILATGWQSSPPGAAWIASAANALGLPRAPCGYPIPDPGLRWAPGLYLTGALAELEVGPAARNIAGARMAASRIREGALD